MTPKHDDSIKQQTLATSYDNTAKVWEVSIKESHQPREPDTF